MKYIARVKKVVRSGIHKTAEIRSGEVAPTGDLPMPDRVEIDVPAVDAPCMMYRFRKTGDACGDTWHANLDDAFHQAEYEYGLTPSDFVQVFENTSSR